MLVNKAPESKKNNARLSRHKRLSGVGSMDKLSSVLEIRDE
jgi:hypothetical protein